MHILQVEKFRPNFKMLTQPEYSLYVVYESGTEHKLAADEKPLLAQLEWVKSNADGRFLLRDENAPREKLEVSCAFVFEFCFENACQMSAFYCRRICPRVAVDKNICTRSQ